MVQENGKVLAMYDVRGIQNYIFRTTKEKDAIGASKVVEDIIEKALCEAVENKELNQKFNVESESELNWKKRADNGEKDEILPYQDSGKKVQVLYIGGGNGLVIFQNKELYIEITKLMSKYVIDYTYSLQLVSTMVEIGLTNNYYEDQHKLRKKMDRVKAEMTVTKPIGAMPVMEVEVKTGFPAMADVDPEILKSSSEGFRIDGTGKKKIKISKESLLKLKAEREARFGLETPFKIFDNYVTKKGTDSTIAIVHIDGNNMGLRIRELMKGRTDYEEAVTVMRGISFNIDYSYKAVFNKMANFFNGNAREKDEFFDKENDFFVLKVLVAGDDVTYICNGKIALDTVDYFCQEISNEEKYSMVAGIDKDLLQKNQKEGDEINPKKYGFDFCAGIAYINSHFPFHAGYAVAEACASNAKKYAKGIKKENERVGNWVDFHICRNIQAKDLGAMRAREYITNHGEQLLLRPYFIVTQKTESSDIKDASRSFSKLKDNILYFQNEDNIPRTFAKELRNIYPQGKNRANLFLAFLKSRNKEMPDNSNDLYEAKYDEKKQSIILTAKWYDALEMMDYYVEVNPKNREESDEAVPDEDKIIK